jgi:hypothetical protein
LNSLSETKYKVSGTWLNDNGEGAALNEKPFDLAATQTYFLKNRLEEKHSIAP